MCILPTAFTNMHCFECQEGEKKTPPKINTFRFPMTNEEKQFLSLPDSLHYERSATFSSFNSSITRRMSRAAANQLYCFVGFSFKSLIIFKDIFI